MTDTPQELKEMQLKIWLSKSPMERLRQMMLDNEALIMFWDKLRISDNFSDKELLNSTSSIDYSKTNK